MQTKDRQKVTANKKFGRWLVVRQAPSSNCGVQMWECICDCGKEVVVRGVNLSSGGSLSCGCYKTEIKTKHKLAHTPEYQAWADMKSRCFNINIPSFKHYGGRGISVCSEWINSFETFYKDMGARPSPDHSLDRRNVNGNYEPGNCRWATWVEQCRNQRNNLFVDYQGTKITLAELSEKTGISYPTLASRIARGMTGDESVDTPIPKRNFKLYTLNGETKNCREWARHYGLNEKAVYYQVNKGMDIREVLGLVTTST
jgi:hypothetical protein